MCQLLIWQCFNLFAQFKTTTKSHENYVSCIHFPIWPYPPPPPPPIPITNFKFFYTSKLYGLTDVIYSYTYLDYCQVHITTSTQNARCHRDQQKTTTKQQTFLSATSNGIKMKPGENDCMNSSSTSLGTFSIDLRLSLIDKSLHLVEVCTCHHNT